ncbi:hypothetical protein [Paenibacillus alginolyticus]|uniref:hypothetical protein n=1 Tax=Paenibacillus alginolyticus TaxID=59839 RepID=UPI001566893F|nr:hypothetical protein [Paenibacillus frigoriresistens]
MLRIIRILGIMFSLIVVAIAIYSSVGVVDLPTKSIISSWMMVGLCFSLIFNGISSYLPQKNKAGLLMSGSSVAILILVLMKFSF